MRTDLTDIIRHETDSQRKHSIVAEVTNVETREQASDDPNVHVDIATRAFDNEIRRVPVVCVDHRGHALVPQEGDAVMVVFLRGTGESPVVTGVVPNDVNRSPLAREGHWRHEWDHGSGRVYLEAEPADHSAGTPDLVRMGVKPDGLSDPSTEVAVDDSAGSTEVRIETDGDVTISADGNVVIDEGGSTKSVLTEDAKFEYEDTTINDTSDGSGTSSTTTKKTTKVVNGETTSVELE